mgnify:FL=1
MQRILTPRRTRRAALALGSLLVAGAAGVASGSVAADFKTPCAGAVIHAQYDNQVVHGTCGDDIIFVGGYTGVTVYAGDGDDSIRGGWGHGVVTVYAGRGNDRVTQNEKRMIVYGEDGDDFLEGGDDHDVLLGGAGKDTLVGDRGVNYLHGGDGDDILISDSTEANAPDTVLGGAGWDKATVDPGDVTYDVEVVKVN